MVYSCGIELNQGEVDMYKTIESEKAKELVKKIGCWCFDKQSRGKIEIFFDLSGHVSNASVHIYSGGYACTIEKYECQLDFSCYCEQKDLKIDEHYLMRSLGEKFEEMKAFYDRHVERFKPENIAKANDEKRKRDIELTKKKLERLMSE